VNRRRVVAGVRAVVGLGLLGFIISRLDLSQLRVPAGPRLAVGFAGACVVLLLGQSFGALRWRTVLGSDAPPWPYLVRLYLIGAFFSLFLPTSVGGDAVRMVAAARNIPRSGEVVASVVVDRGLGVMALVVYLLLGLVVVPSVLPAAGARLGLDLHGRRAALAAVAVGLCVVAAAGAAWFLPAVRRWLLEAGGLVRRLLSQPRVALSVGLLAMLVQGLYVVAWIVLAAGMGLGLRASIFLVTVPLVSLGAMLPITLSGLGVREGVWLLLLRPYGLAPATIVAFSLLYFVCVMVVGALGGLIFVVRGTDLAKPGAAPSRAAP
jgi:uncharacterized membrane protein YbhN (UPF0104 family)